MLSPIPDRATRPQTPLALLQRAALHEFHSGQGPGDAAVSGALLGFAWRAAAGRQVLLARHALLDGECGAPYAYGLREFGIDPSCLILARAADSCGALQAGLEGARCGALGAVIIELWGETRSFDLTAGRRLVLAAQASGTPVFLGRFAARPQPSAAETRWLVEPGASEALEANAPGSPVWVLTLLRHRGGLPSMRWRLEWNRDRARFDERIVPESEPVRTSIKPPLSGAVVSFPVDREDAAPDGRDLEVARLRRRR